nr:hypothetical protein [Ishige okamurae]
MGLLPIQRNFKWSSSYDLYNHGTSFRSIYQENSHNLI